MLSAKQSPLYSSKCVVSADKPFESAAIWCINNALWSKEEEIFSVSSRSNLEMMAIQTWSDSAHECDFMGCTIPISRNDQGEEEYLIITRHGLLPNDMTAMYNYWTGVNCSNGMRECMSLSDFQIWWAKQIAKAYDKYCESN